jgi:hypothetical protein
MKVVKPNIFVSSMLASTTAVESVAAWSSVTTYALDAGARTGNRIYQSLIASNLNFPPAANITRWVDVGPDNTTAAFDGQVSTSSTGASSLAFTLNTGIVDTVALVNVAASSIAVTVRDGPGGTIIFAETAGMDGSTVTDWYQYFFFDPLLVRTQVLFDNIPPFASANVQIEITGGGAVSVGHIAFGRSADIGGTNYGATAGITDYSTKTTDAFGVATFVRRAFSKRMTARLNIDNLQLNRVQRLLYDLRATPCVWIGADDGRYDEPLTVFGYYRDFSTDVAYSVMSLCSLEIEGLA